MKGGIGVTVCHSSLLDRINGMELGSRFMGMLYISRESITCTGNTFVNFICHGFSVQLYCSQDSAIILAESQMKSQENNSWLHLLHVAMTQLSHKWASSSAIGSIYKASLKMARESHMAYASHPDPQISSPPFITDDHKSP